METPHFLIFMVVFLVLFLIWRNQKAVVAKKQIKRKKMKEKEEMIELAKRFIDKECIISAFDGNHQFSGVIKEVVDGAVLLDNGGKLEAVNLDYVIRIREYPRDKKGKKKKVILD